MNTDESNYESIYDFKPGTMPLLVSIPHVGTHLPEALLPRLSDRARTVPDTDWHLEALYDFLDDLNVSVLVARHSRYVIDLNRPPDNQSLYPGVATTELCPTRLFDGSAIYRDGEQPDAQEIAQRLQQYWQPYHDQIRAELTRLVDRYGIALLWDAHSIRSQLPRLFQGRLPDLNIGTFSGNSAAASLAEQLVAVAQRSPYSQVLNGRFQGGYITRHYGQPAANIHAVQLELVQATYMQEDPPFMLLEDRANAIRPVLRQLLETAIEWACCSSQPDRATLLHDSHTGVVSDRIG